MRSQGLCRFHFGPAELLHGERSPQSQEPQPCHLCLVHQMPISSLAIASCGRVSFHNSAPHSAAAGTGDTGRGLEGPDQSKELLSHRGAVLAGEAGAPVQLHHHKALGLPISFPWEGQGGRAGALPSLEDCLAFRWSLCCAELPVPLEALPGQRGWAVWQ